jgi:Na+/melibiose symporter-like transporter
MSRRPAKKRDQKKNNLPALFILNTILWFIYGIYIYYDMAVRNNNTNAADVVTLFVFVNAILMFVSGIMLRKFEIERYYFALLVVALNILLMLFNLSDLFFLTSFLLDLIILLLLIPLRKNYTSVQ